MRAAQLRSLCVLLAILCTGCSHKTPVTPQQAQAPPLQTGKGTLEPPKTDAAGGKVRHAAGFAVTAAVCAKRALASSDAEEGEEAQEAQAGRFTSGYGRALRLRLRIARQALRSGHSASYFPAPATTCGGGQLCHWPVDDRRQRLGRKNQA